jgi:hypothetical protein
MTPSSLPVARLFPSGENVTETTFRSCPFPIARLLETKIGPHRVDRQDRHVGRTGDRQAARIRSEGER